jgi:DNA-binding NarL/FixJ family response regulator
MFESAGERVELADRRDPGILTDREIQVLELLCKGKLYAEIALDLEISASTVGKHARSLQQKLKAASRRDITELPSWWLR